ncbi:MAG TPA: IPT/TIG domain-containing protein, partial [Thermoanaerobaculia bacterium]
MRRLILVLLASSLSAFATPHVNSIDPSIGSTAGGTYVDITGGDLNGFALACPSIDCADYVQIGGLNATLVAADASERVVIAPPHAAGIVDVVVNVAGRAKITIPNGFRYQDAEDTDYERLLIPVVNGGPGAFGSSWQPDITMHNASSATVFPQAPTCNPFILAPCLQFHIDPHATVHVTLYPANGNPGAIVRIPRNVADQIDVQSRIQDISRQKETWGTTLPVVRESDFKPVIRLHAVPADSRFRDTLRVYGFLRAGTVTVKVIDEATNATIASTELPLV